MDRGSGRVGVLGAIELADDPRPLGLVHQVEVVEGPVGVARQERQRPAVVRRELLGKVGRERPGVERELGVTAPAGLANRQETRRWMEETRPVLGVATGDEADPEEFGGGA